MIFSLAAVSLATASIVHLTLREMLERTDSGVIGTVLEKNVWTGPLEGFEVDPDFTTVKIQGEDLIRGGQVIHEITYLGSDKNPVSEMPAESETRVGTSGLFFSVAVKSAWGGRTGLHSLMAAQGGVFRVESGPKGDVVIGKGEGFAVEKNVLASDLRKQVAAELAEIRRTK